jgi:hypothetical protein
MFKVRQRATIAQAPEGLGSPYNEGDEVIVETTFDEGFSHARIVGPAAPKTPNPEAFSETRTSNNAHLDAAFSAAGAGLAKHVREGNRLDLKTMVRILEEANYTLRGKGLVIKPDYKVHGATEFVVVKVVSGGTP